MGRMGKMPSTILFIKSRNIFEYVCIIRKHAYLNVYTRKFLEITESAKGNLCSHLLLPETRFLWGCTFFVDGSIYDHCPEKWEVR